MASHLVLCTTQYYMCECICDMDRTEPNMEMFKKWKTAKWHMTTFLAWDLLMPSVERRPLPPAISTSYNSCWTREKDMRTSSKWQEKAVSSFYCQTRSEISDQLQYLSSACLWLPQPNNAHVICAWERRTGWWQLIYVFTDALRVGSYWKTVPTNVEFVRWSSRQVRHWCRRDRQSEDVGPRPHSRKLSLSKKKTYIKINETFVRLRHVVDV